MNYDIVVIGGGHSGVEAAHIASQFKDLKIAIITLPGVGLASAPCNPSIGGVGKGQVVRELDAMGGLIGKLADYAGIQYRTLNESKGYAVQSTRVQIDKVLYSKKAEDMIASISNIDVIYEKIEGIEKKADSGFLLRSDSSTWNTKSIIVTVGTFLNGKLHTGKEKRDGGRDDCDSSSSLANFFGSIKTVSARFKTGTPARIDKASVNYECLEEQPSSPDVFNFHHDHEPHFRFQDQISCHLAYTNSETMKLIRDNKEKSPLFNGQINAVGARYCPSIEDKAYRYPDKDKHHVFVEPESHYLDTLYPSGISTSLPKDIQEKMVRSIKGLERAEIINYGYAVEYDVIDTTLLSYSLEYKDIEGLYFAGQINGTSGYEEAAAQGFIAGINASLKILGKKEIVLSRNDSYIGVMIEDLISNVRDEPYRLFTARSENRLYIREDNSILRMNKYRKKAGLNESIDNYNQDFISKVDIYSSLLDDVYINPKDKFLAESSIDIPRRMSLSELLKQSKIDPVQVLKDYFDFVGLEENLYLTKTLAISAKYDGYINKADAEQARQNKLNRMKVSWEDVCKSENISFECKQRIEKIRPETFGQLKLIEGLRPATLAVVASGSY